MWVIGRKLRTVSSWCPSTPNPVSAVMALEEMFSWVSITPFGRPVVPLV